MALPSDEDEINDLLKQWGRKMKGKVWFVAGFKEDGMPITASNLPTFEAQAEFLKQIIRSFEQGQPIAQEVDWRKP